MLWLARRRVRLQAWWRALTAPSSPRPAGVYDSRTPMRRNGGLACPRLWGCAPLVCSLAAALLLIMFVVLRPTSGEGTLAAAGAHFPAASHGALLAMHDEDVLTPSGKASAAMRAVYLPAADVEDALGQHAWDSRFYVLVHERDWLRPGAAQLFLNALFLAHPHAMALVVDLSETARTDVAAAVSRCTSMGYASRVVHLPTEELLQAGWWLSESGRQWLAAVTGDSSSSSGAGAGAGGAGGAVPPQLAGCSGSGAGASGAAAAAGARACPFADEHTVDMLRAYLLYTYGGTAIAPDVVLVRPLAHPLPHEGVEAEAPMGKPQQSLLLHRVQGVDTQFEATDDDGDSPVRPPVRATVHRFDAAPAAFDGRAKKPAKAGVKHAPSVGPSLGEFVARDRHDAKQAWFHPGGADNEFASTAVMRLQKDSPVARAMLDAAVFTVAGYDGGCRDCTGARTLNEALKAAEASARSAAAAGSPAPAAAEGNGSIRRDKRKGKRSTAGGRATVPFSSQKRLHADPAPAAVPLLLPVTSVFPAAYDDGALFRAAAAAGSKVEAPWLYAQHVLRSGVGVALRDRETPDGHVVHAGSALDHIMRALALVPLHESAAAMAPDVLTNNRVAFDPLAVEGGGPGDADRSCRLSMPPAVVARAARTRLIGESIAFLSQCAALSPTDPATGRRRDVPETTVRISTTAGTFHVDGANLAVQTSHVWRGRFNVQEINALLQQIQYVPPATPTIAADAITVTISSIDVVPTSADNSVALSRVHVTASSHVLLFNRLVTVMTHTAGRTDSVRQLYNSIQRGYPGTQVLGSDDTGAQEVTSQLVFGPHMAWVKVPRDCGLSVARNRLVEAAKTPYVQLLDDDFTAEEGSHLDLLLMQVHLSKYDIASPVIPADMKTFINFRGFIDTSRGNLELKPGMYGRNAFECATVDFVANVFMGRRSALALVKWDEDLKLGEHENFFLRAKQAGLRIASCDHIAVYHHQQQWWDPSTAKDERDAEYFQRRSRVFEFMKMSLRKHGLKKLISFGTTMVEVE